MTTVRGIYAAINKKAPFDSAMSFDNVGVLVGDEGARVTKTLIALDITKAVVREAERLSAELIISHHPVIFDALKALKRGTPPYELAAVGINALCCHTNLDIADDIGVNLSLAKKLGLTSIEKHGEVLLVGKIKPSTVSEFAERLKSVVGAEKITFTKSDETIEKISVCCGAGGDYITEAMECSDAFVTGEAHHDELILAADNSFPFFVAGHYETEKLFAQGLKTYLDEQFADVDFILSEDETNPIVSI